jgi:hypothetical protein
LFAELDVPRRKSDDPDVFAPDPDEFRIESVGSVLTLTEKELPGKPFKPAKHPLGFDLRPGVHRKKHRKWRKVRVLR